MNISLRLELENLIHEKIQRGEYRSADEALNEAVELLKQRDEAERELETLLQDADSSGPAVEMTAQDWATIRQEVNERARIRKAS